ncbi:hypothetical protein BN946_scf184817.g8 [Trametes cinnabarina]|uniref:Uncharacterized protein n=1 Tax=Pycnoporus cinnabarinus TaxID=5643 RepID=A0A060SAN0_PYCCI|nr:hypothetical protein BN946_scf184817.g8 [Trametes cinnabarina]
MVDANVFTLPGLEQDGSLMSVLVRYRPEDKETWLPTVEELFAIQRTTRTNAFAVVEAWSMDLPTHGHAAVINEKALVAYGHKISEQPPSSDAVHWTRWLTHVAGWHVARALLAFLGSGLVAPGAKVVAVGHSASAAIIVEATEHAMRDLPTASYPDLKEGVTLSVTRENEGAGYDGYDDGRAALRRLETLCAEVPVHCVFGGQNDMVPLEAQEAFLDEKTGRRMRSIVRVAGSGHLVVQENPGALARAIWGVLHEDYAAPVVVAAKL